MGCKVKVNGNETTLKTSLESLMRGELSKMSPNQLNELIAKSKEGIKIEEVRYYLHKLRMDNGTKYESLDAVLQAFPKLASDPKSKTVLRVFRQFEIASKRLGVDLGIENIVLSDIQLTDKPSGILPSATYSTSGIALDRTLTVGAKDQLIPKIAHELFHKAYSLVREDPEFKEIAAALVEEYIENLPITPEARGLAEGIRKVYPKDDFVEEIIVVALEGDLPNIQLGGITFLERLVGTVLDAVTKLLGLIGLSKTTKKSMQEAVLANYNRAIDLRLEAQQQSNQQNQTNDNTSTTSIDAELADPIYKAYLLDKINDSRPSGFDPLTESQYKEVIEVILSNQTLYSLDILDSDDKSVFTDIYNKVIKGVRGSILFESQSNVEYKDFIKKLFPDVRFEDKLNNISLTNSLIAFRSQSSPRVKLRLLRSVVSNIWYNVLNNAEKEGIKQSLTSIDPRIFSYPERITFQGDELIIDPSAFSYTDDGLVMVAYSLGKKALVNFYRDSGQNIFIINEETGNAVPVKSKDREDLSHIFVTHDLMTTNFSKLDIASLSDFEVINLVSNFYGYSSFSDTVINPSLDELMKELGKDESEVFNNTSSLYGLLNKMQEGGFYSKMDNPSIELPTINLSTVFGDFENGEYKNGHINIRKYNYVIDSLMYTLLSGRPTKVTSSLPQYIQDTLISSEAGLEEKLVDTLKFISTHKVTTASGRKLPNVYASAAKALLQPLAYDTLLEGVKESKLAYLYRLKVNDDLDYSNVGVASLGDTNDKIDHAASSGRLARLFLSFISKPDEESYYDYNFMFVLAIKLFSDKEGLGTMSDIKELSKYLTDLKNKGAVSTARLASELEQLVRNIQNAKHIKHSAIREDNEGIHYFYHPTKDVSSFSMQEKELLDTDVLTVSATSIEDLYDRVNTLSYESPEQGLDKSEFYALFKKARAIETFRGLQSYIGSLTEKDYNYYDTANGKYVPYARRGVQQSVGAAFYEKFLNPNIKYDATTSTYVIKPQDTFSTMQAVFKNLGLAGVSSVLDQGRINTSKALSAYNLIIREVNKVLAPYIGQSPSPEVLAAINSGLNNINFSGQFKEIEALLNVLQENYANVSVTSPDGDKIYKYTMGSFMTYKLATREESQSKLANFLLTRDTKYVDTFSFYTGNKNTNFTKPMRSYWSEDQVEFARRDIKAFISKYNESGRASNPYFDYSLNSQGDKSKGLVFRARMITNEDELNTLLEMVLDEYREAATKGKINIAKSIAGKEISTIQSAEEFKLYINEYVKQMVASLKSMDRKNLLAGLLKPENEKALNSYVAHNIIYGLGINSYIAGNFFDYKNDEDLIKRLTGSLAPGVSLYTGVGGANTSFGIVQLGDIETETSGLFGESKALNELFNQLTELKDNYYKKVGERYELTDGQGFMTERRFLELNNGLPSSYKLTQVVKPVIFDGDSYFKYSSFVFTKEIAKFMGAEDLYNRVIELEDSFRSIPGNEKKTLEFLFISASKKNKSKIPTLSMSDVVNFKSGETSYSKEVPTKGYRLQLNPALGQSKTSFPIQPAYFLTSNPTAYATLTNAWSKLLELGIDEFRNALPLDRTTQTRTVKTQAQRDVEGVRDNYIKLLTQTTEELESIILTRDADADTTEEERKLGERIVEFKAKIDKANAEISGLENIVEVETINWSSKNENSIKSFIRSKLQNSNLKVGELLDIGLPMSHSLIFKPCLDTFLSASFRQVYKHTVIDDSGQLVLANSSLFDPKFRPRYFLKRSDAYEQAETQVRANFARLFGKDTLSEADEEAAHSLMLEEIEKLKKVHAGKQELVATCVVPAKFLSDEQKKNILLLNNFRKALEFVQSNRKNYKKLNSKDQAKFNNYVRFITNNEKQVSNLEYPTLLGFRTPATGLHSMLNIRVERFHEEDSKTIYVPQELSILSGADRLDVGNKLH